jgi:hypothetical protein
VHRGRAAHAHLSDLVAHAIACDHGAGEARGLLQVARRARGHIPLTCTVQRKQWVTVQEGQLSRHSTGRVQGPQAQRWLPAARQRRGQAAHGRPPKMSSSATRPPMHTSSLASSWRRDTLVSSSVSGSCVTMPSAMPGRDGARRQGEASRRRRWSGLHPGQWLAGPAQARLLCRFCGGAPCLPF